MHRRALPIALAALAIAGCDSSEPAATTEAAPPASPPLERCPPPGPAVVDPRTGRTLCGDAARRYVREDQRRRRRMIGPPQSLLRQGRRIIAADPTLSAILRGHEHRIARLGGWSAGDGGTELLGVAGVIELDEPIVVDAVLPYVCAGDPAKGSGRLRLRAGNVGGLEVLARFSTRRVAEIGPTAKIGSRFEGYRSERLPGSTKCPPSEH